jgi:hypothetical protein
MKPTMLTESEKLKIEIDLQFLNCSLEKKGEIIINTKEHGRKVYDKSLFDCPEYLEIKQDFIRSVYRNPYN